MHCVEPLQKGIVSFRADLMKCSNILCLQRNFPKIQRQIFLLGWFLLLFFKGRSNQFELFTGLLHFNTHPYWLPQTSYSHAAIWQYGRNTAIKKYGQLTFNIADRVSHKNEGLRDSISISIFIIFLRLSQYTSILVTPKVIQPKIP